MIERQKNSFSKSGLNFKTIGFWEWIKMTFIVQYEHDKWTDAMNSYIYIIISFNSIIQISFSLALLSGNDQDVPAIGKWHQ